MIVQQWKQAGVDAKVDVAQGTLPTRRAAGDFDTFIGWSVETWGGHQDLSYFMDSWHSQFVAPPGKTFGTFTRPGVRFGKPLEEIMAGRDHGAGGGDRVPAARARPQAPGDGGAQHGAI